MILRIFLVLSFLFVAAPVKALDRPVPLNDVEEAEVIPWQETDYTLPPFPKEEDLVEFSVDGTPNSKAYIDKTSIGAGTQDNVVRYVMVIKSKGGAVNISYEGIRCDTNELRLYATGTRENTWSKSRDNEWRLFKIHNRQQKSLANYYFCPGFTSIKTSQEGIDALRLGMHPRAAQRLYVQ
jgi:hypothetical protein